MILYALVLVFIWLMFFRKSEGCCGMPMVA
jgi:hypothetical protein